MKVNKWLVLLVIIIMPLVIFHRFAVNALLSSEIFTAQQLYLVKFYDRDLYHQHIFRQSNKGSELWLDSGQYLAKHNADMAVSLAQFYLSTKAPEKALLWLKQAVRIDNQQALATKLLAQYYVNNNQFEQAVIWAEKQLSVFWAQKIVIEHAINNGNVERIGQVLPVLKKSAQGIALASKLAYFGIFPQKNINEERQLLPQKMVSCDNYLQFFATDLKGLSKAQQFIEQSKDKYLGQQFCFGAPRYIPLKELACRHEQDQMIQCNESIWENIVIDRGVRYLSVIVPAGGANVSSGIMYLDQQDSFQVFAHELAHFLGFIDEYPLPKNHGRCRTEQRSPFAHNVATLPRLMSGDRKQVRSQVLAQLPWKNLIKDTTPILSKQGSKWLVGTPTGYQEEIGLFRAKTCERTKVQAFKPINSINSLQYFEIEFPKIYQQLHQASPDRFLMPSFHFNYQQ